MLRILGIDCSSHFVAIFLVPVLGAFLPIDRAAAQPTSVRSYDGSGNNVANPTWGQAGTRLLRKSPAAYPGDGSGATILLPPTRPNARDVSNGIAAQGATEIPNARRMSNLVWQWGQFVDHDIDLTSSDPNAGGADIPVQAGDVLGPNPIPFVRSVFDPATGTPDAPRQQINQITAYLDASMVYGSSRTTADSLRTGSGGKLKTTAGGLLLPTDGDGNFLAGDVRVNEQVGLTAMHTLFVREHNRLCEQIARVRPGLDDEATYQWARKIVGAEVQIVTYEEFLPALLDWYAPSPKGGRSYRDDVDPGIANEFSTALFRVGHTMLAPNLPLIDSRGRQVGSIPLRDCFFQPGILAADPDRVGLILHGLGNSQAQEIDNKIVDDVRNFLFGPAGSGGLDLASLNIQRGRDHGLPDYNSVRAAYGLRKVASFDEISSSATVRQALAALYADVDSIDPWVGALAEDHRQGTSVGPLISAGLRDQFERLRTGDRFYWNRDPDLRGSRLKNIVDLDGRRLSDILRDNTQIAAPRKNLFLLPGKDRGRDDRRAGNGPQDDRP